MINEAAMKELDYGITMAVQALIEAMGMMAENQQRIHRGESLAYTEVSFNALIAKHGIHHNSIMSRWQRIYIIPKKRNP